MRQAIESSIIISALPGSKKELIERTGILPRSMYNVLKRLHDRREIHIKRWERSISRGPIIPIYDAGDECDALCELIPLTKTQRHQRYKAKTTVKAAKLSPGQLHELLNYDSDTGVLTWKHKVANSVNANDVCGSITGGGQLRIRYQGHTYAVHLIAFAMTYGYWAVNEVDHINRNMSDNRISNLREATHAENCRNRTNKSNSTGFKGVSFHKGQGKYSARIMINGKSIHIGSFDNSKDAAIAYNSAAIELHGEFALTNQIESITQELEIAA